MAVSEPKGRSQQLLWSHVDCLTKTLNKIPFASLSDRIDIYDEWVQEQVENLEVGHLVKGRIAFIKDYGMAIEISEGFHALLHISEISQQSVEDLNQIFSVGDFVRALIIDIDRPKGRVSLSTSVLEETPGDMISDAQKVFDGAEDMAEKYSDKN